MKNEMESMLNGTMGAAKHVVESTREGAEHALESAKHGTNRAVTSTWSNMMEAVRTVSGLIASFRRFDGDDALALIGLARRRSALPSIALFGAGMAVGAGVGMLFAPMSGDKLRGVIKARVNGLKEQAEATVEHAAAEVKNAEHEVEDLAGKAGDAVKKAEKKVESKVESKVAAINTTARHSS